MNEDRRQVSHIKAMLPIDLSFEPNTVPLRASTCDISLGGCYVESLFPLEIGIALEARVRLEDYTIIAVGEIVTCDAQVGNDIRFTMLLPEDAQQLREFIDAMERAPKSTE